MPERTVLLMTSHHAGWAGVRMVLNSLPDVHVAGEARNARQAVQLATSLDPDVIVAARKIDRTSSLPLLTEIRARCPASQIVIIATGFDPEESFVLATLRIENFLLWRDIDWARARELLATVIDSGFCVNSESVVDAFLEALENRLYAGRVSVQLGERERAVLRGLVEGLTQKEIAAREGVSSKTVKRMIANLQRKLDVPSVSALCYKVGQLGLLGLTVLSLL